MPFGFSLAGLWVRLSALAAAVVAGALIVWRIFAAGRRAQRDADSAAATAALKDKKEADDASRRLSDADLDRANARWVRR